MNKQIQIPGPPVGYTDLMDYEITAKLEQEQKDYKSGKKKRYFPLRPSSAGYCARRLAYSLMEYYGYADYDLPINSPQLHRLFNLGHSVEYSVLRQFEIVDLITIRYKQAPLTCFELEATKIEPKKIIEGSCDACFFSEKYKCICDVKSVKDGFSKAFTTRWTELLDKFAGMETLIKLSDTAFYADDVEAFLGELGEDFLSENIIQLNLYACTDFMRERGVDHAVVYKYNKNDSRHYELRFRPSIKLAKVVEQKYNDIMKAVAKKKPESLYRNYNLGSMHCAFCPMNKQCWPEEDAKREYFRSLPKKNWPKDITTLDNEVLPALFSQYETHIKRQTEMKNLEAQIINIMHNNDWKRIKLENGHIFEIKKLKSPREHFELRQSKL